MKADPNGAPEVSFVIPLYNTGNALPKLLDAFRDLPIYGGYEVIFVNDASPDGTGERLEKALENLPYSATFLDMARNYGEHAAVLEGYRHARGKYIVNLDDDLQNPVEEALRILNQLREGRDEVVYTWFEEKKHHPVRNLGSWFTNQAASFLIGKPQDLYLSSFRGLRRELLNRITQYRGPYPYIDGLILGATNRIGRLKVAHRERADGQSNYTVRRLVRLWMNMFFNFSVMPLRLAGVLGLCLSFLGLLLILMVLAEKLFHETPIQGWASLMAAISVFAGAQLLILGVMGEYLGRTYLTLAGKPQSLPRSIIRHEPRPG